MDNIGAMVWLSCRELGTSATIISLQWSWEVGQSVTIEDPWFKTRGKLLNVAGFPIFPVSIFISSTIFLCSGFIPYRNHHNT